MTEPSHAPSVEQLAEFFTAFCDPGAFAAKHVPDDSGWCAGCATHAGVPLPATHAYSPEPQPKHCGRRRISVSGKRQCCVVV